MLPVLITAAVGVTSTVTYVPRQRATLLAGTCAAVPAPAVNSLEPAPGPYESCSVGSEAGGDEA